MRMRSGQWAGSVPGGKRVRKYVREPRDWTLSATNLLSPPIMAAMEMTEDTPITMPMTVRNERTFAERSVSMAARKFSRACDVVIMAIGFYLRALKAKPRAKPENAEVAEETEVFLGCVSQPAATFRNAKSFDHRYNPKN